MPFITRAGNVSTIAPSVNAITPSEAKTSAAHHGRLMLSLISSEDSEVLPLPTDSAPLLNEVLSTATQVSWIVKKPAHKGRTSVLIRDETVTSIGQKAKSDGKGTFDCPANKPSPYLWVFADSTGKDNNHGIRQYAEKELRVNPAVRSQLPLS